MSWIQDYDLYLFDFDGLLVNTEIIHYQAYQKMCADRGFILPWDFPRYIEAAHYRAEGLEEQIYAEFPRLKEIEPSWNVLYAEKKAALVYLLTHETIPLMPGVEKLLHALSAQNKKMCVVTHSDPELVALIRSKNPVLDCIPYWVTRHDYTHPKPDSECYLKAIATYAAPGDRIVGFEDSPRGMRALLGAPAQAVMVSIIDYPELAEFKQLGAIHLHSFEEVCYAET